MTAESGDETCRTDGCTNPVEFPNGEGEHCITHCAEIWAQNEVSA